MAEPQSAQETRAWLAHRLSTLRVAAKVTQKDLAFATGYSRTTIADAESRGAGSRDFYSAVGRELGAGDELALVVDRLTALTAASRRDAVRRQRETIRRRRLERQQAAHRAGPDPHDDAAPLIAAQDAACPHCGKPVVVLGRLDLSVLPLETTTEAAGNVGNSESGVPDLAHNM